MTIHQYNPLAGVVPASGGEAGGGDALPFIDPAVDGNLPAIAAGGEELVDSGVSVADLQAQITDSNVLFEWNGTDLSQFIDSTDLSVGVSVCDPTRNAIKWSPLDNAQDARFFDFVMPRACLFEWEVAKPNAGSHSIGVAWGVDADNWVMDGSYQASSMRLAGRNAGVNVAMLSYGNRSYQIGGGLYTYTSTLTEITLGLNPGIWKMNCRGWTTPTTRAQDTMWSPSAAWAAGTPRPCIAYGTVAAPGVDWEWLSFRVLRTS